MLCGSGHLQVQPHFFHLFARRCHLPRSLRQSAASQACSAAPAALCSSRRFVPACLPCGGLHVGYASRLPPRLLQNKLGGGEGVEGLYGSIKRSGMDKVGSCRPPAHAAPIACRCRHACAPATGGSMWHWQLGCGRQPSRQASRPGFVSCCAFPGRCWSACAQSAAWTARRCWWMWVPAWAGVQRGPLCHISTGHYHLPTAAVLIVSQTLQLGSFCRQCSS